VDPAAALQTLNHGLFTGFAAQEAKPTGVAIICICICGLGQLYFYLNFLSSFICRTFQRPFVTAAG
jgi:hypothetical protein